MEKIRLKLSQTHWTFAINYDPDQGLFASLRLRWD